MTKQSQPLLALAERIEEANGDAISIDPQAAAELRRLAHSNTVLMNALLKACADDKETAQEIINFLLERVNRNSINPLVLQQAVRAIAKATGEIK